jgi:hypothetical protein
LRRGRCPQGRADIDITGHLPHDVGGLGTASEEDLRATAFNDAAGGLEDEHAIGAGAVAVGALDVSACEDDVGAPLLLLLLLLFSRC